MAYLIRNSEGKYLLRLAGAKKRKWVDSLDEATTWLNLGAVKNAIRAHLGATTSNGKGQLLYQEVKLMTWGSPIPFPTKDK